MLAQRFTQQSLRRLTSAQPSTLLLSQFIAPAAVSTNRSRIQSRPAATQSLKPTDAYQILVKQRLNRPVSPHLSIYQPQLTWYLSILNRITGSILSGGLYCFGAAYLVAPLLGWHLESAVLAASFGSLPVAAKVGIKFAVALPFTFHSWNGIRHLVWDTGREFSNQQVVTTAYVVMGATAVSSGLLAFI